MTVIYTTSIESYNIWSRFNSYKYRTILVGQDKQEIQRLNDQFILNSHPFRNQSYFGKGYYLIKKIGALTDTATNRKSYYARALFQVSKDEPFLNEVEVTLYLNPLYNYSSVGRKDIPIENLIGATIHVNTAFIVRTCTSKADYKTINYNWNISEYADDGDHL